MRLALMNRDGGLEFLTERLGEVLPGAEISVWPAPEAREAEVAVCWNPLHGDLASMPNLRLVHSIGAGVDNLMADPTLPQVPVARIRDDDLAIAMAEYCHWGTLWFQRGFDRIVGNARERVWERFGQRAAGSCRVGVLGLGTIGATVATRLSEAGYPVHGWSRSQRDLPGVSCHAGDAGLEGVLSISDVLICLLPLTPDTRGLLNRARLSKLPEGAALILTSRGEHLVPEDLIRLIEEGHLRGAILDVFAEEPLPAENPIWDRPEILVTPHMAALTKPRRIAEQIAENVLRLKADKPLRNLVDRSKGY